MHIGRAQYKLVGAPVQKQDVPPDVTFWLRSTVGDIGPLPIPGDATGIERSRLRRFKCDDRELEPFLQIFWLTVPGPYGRSIEVELKSRDLQWTSLLLSISVQP